VPPDYAGVEMWYRRAEDNNSSRAAINLGNLYEQGLGVPKDPVQALNWYRRAAGLPEISFEPAPGKTPAELRAQEKQIADLNARLQSKETELDKSEKELARLQQKLKDGQAEIHSLPKGPASPPSPPGATNRQGTPAPANVPDPGVQAQLAAKEREMKVLSDQIAQMQRGSGATKQEITSIKQELDQTQTDVRALRAGLQPA